MVKSQRTLVEIDKKTRIMQSCKEGDSIKFMVEMDGLDIDDTSKKLFSDDDGQNPIHICCIKDKMSLLDDIFSFDELYFLLNARDKKGLTPLHHAAQCKNVNACKKLIWKGADIYAKTPEGNTALHILSSCDIMKLNSDIDVETALSVLIALAPLMSIRNKKGETPSHLLAANGILNSLKPLVRFNGIKSLMIPNYDGESPLQMAEKSNHKVMVRYIKAMTGLGTFSGIMSEEVLLNVFHYLTSQEMNQVALVCKTFYRISWQVSTEANLSSTTGLRRLKVREPSSTDYESYVKDIDWRCWFRYFSPPNTSKVSERTYKLTVVGSSSSGKTSLIRTFAEGGVFPTDVKPTSETEMSARYIEYKGKMVKISISDVATSKKNNMQPGRNFKGAMGIVYLLDLTNPNAIQSINEWLSETDRFAREVISKIIIGSKSDCKHRVIETKDAKKFASDIGIPYIEVSSKADPFSVEVALAAMISDITAKKSIEEPIPTSPVRRSTRMTNSSSEISLSSQLKPKKSQDCNIM